MNSVIVWSIIFVLIALFAYYATRMARRDDREDGLHDFGFALLEFGRAFPNEAIREIHATADGRAVFVRLHDGKTGIMRSHTKHYACHLIKPGRVRVQGQEGARSFRAEFLDAPANDGLFTFRTEAEAAEVSLWLLGNYVSSADKDVTEDGA
nr:type III secretion system apparatus protein SsaK [Rhizobium sp. Khangiran2]